jgi:hypothetical protein
MKTQHNSEEFSHWEALIRRFSNRWRGNCLHARKTTQRQISMGDNNQIATPRYRPGQKLIEVQKKFGPVRIKS